MIFSLSLSHIVPSPVQPALGTQGFPGTGGITPSINLIYLREEITPLKNLKELLLSPERNK